MKDRWSDKSRMEKIAGVMWPSLLPEQQQREMLAANEEQRAGLERRIAQGQREIGVRPSVAPSSLDRVPGLKRVDVKVHKSWWEK